MSTLFGGDLHAGIAGIELQKATFSLGHGLTLSKTYAHLMAPFVMAFERECTETFWEGHVQAFEFFSGVPKRITYDNTKVAVAKILGGGKDRRLTQGFLQLKSHHLFEHHFCRVARGNEKGVVEGLVKFTRLNFFVPVPQVRDLAELNAHLRLRCEADQQRKLRGQTGTKAQLLLEGKKALLSLPAGRFEACRESLDHRQQPVVGAV